MLNFMRRNANSWIMILLFSIIIFVFAINFGPWAGNLSPSVPYAAMVNNESISMSEFRIAYASQLARIKQFRPDYDQTQAEQDGLKELIMDQLIGRELLNQEAHRLDLMINAKTLAKEIKDRVFGPNEPFNKEEYMRRVNAFFQAPISEFEDQIRKELSAEAIINLLETFAYVSDDEALMSFKGKNTKVALEFVKVDPDHFTPPKEIGKEQVKSFQEANEKKIRDHYNEHISEYIKEEEIRASHILVKVDVKAPAADKAAKKDKALKILELVKNNEDFQAIAQKESDDTGSKEKGGDLGFFTRGDMVEQFSEAAFALKPGETSGIVETPFGFHIIKQTERRPRTERQLADVSEEIAIKLLKQEEKIKKAKQIATMALDQFKKGVLLEKIKIPNLVNMKAAKTRTNDFSAPIADETEPFTKMANYINKIGKAPDALKDTAFLLTLKNPVPDEIIEVNGKFLAIRLKSHDDPDMTKFKDQEEAVKSALIFPRKRALTQQYISYLKTSAKISYNTSLIKDKEMDL
jgi:peptidyl-prolyl cis-trans isomerase D